MITSMFFKVAAIVVASVGLICGLIWGIPKLTELTVEGLGVGIFFLLLWIAAILWVVFSHRTHSFIRWWHRRLGALLLTLALFGILGLFHPGSIFGTGTASAGGALGASLAGGSYGWLRISLLVIAGVVLVTPRGFVRFMEWLRDSAFPAIGRGGARFNQWLQRSAFPAMGRGWIRFKGWFRRPSHPVMRREEAAPPIIKEVKAKAKAEVKEKPTPKVPTTAEVPPPTEAKIAPEEIAPIDAQLPSLELLEKAPEVKWGQAGNEARAKLLEQALASYGVEAKVMQINPGPSVTQFGVAPGWDHKYRRVLEREPNGKARLDRDGSPKVRLEEVSKTRVKVERIASLANDLALALAVPSIRVESPVPGTGLVGIEVPNTGTALVSLRSVVESATFQKIRSKSKLAVALGKGAGGEPVVADLTKMPHLLVAGATGTGKTVCLNSMITCLLMHTTPAEVRLIIIDPKRVEMIAFSDVPHLMTSVVVEIDKVIEVLRRITREMDNRYRKLAAAGVRKIENYNQKAVEPLPYIVVLVDELADLMMASAEIIEPLICRLAQLSRATGIHLVLATQRPSVDVVTGLIKANFPSRISFAVPSAVDSRTILDASGAERLIGPGDMLYLPPDAAKPVRLRGCFVSDREIEAVVDFWKHWTQTLAPVDRIAQAFVALEAKEPSDEPLLEKAREIAREHKHISTSLLQRRLRIGYPRAARIMDLLEAEGLTRPSEGASTEDTEKGP
jgi:S-DNA-T family DNA segregation ATPase FtsK/SpoIIIE